MARSFTREEFYELVWSKPLTRLAKEFYMSDVALHKICRKHDIPNPPLGWWNKKEAGKPVERTPLPKAKGGTARKILIANADLSKEAATLPAVREQARVQASSGDGADDGPHHRADAGGASQSKGPRKGPYIRFRAWPYSLHGGPRGAFKTRRPAYGREIATCTNAAGRDVEREMVRQGWAIPYWRYDGARYSEAMTRH